jgi:DNA polymerase-1
MKAKTIALIDGDIYIYKAASSVEHIIDWDGDFYTWHAKLTDAQEVFEQLLGKFIKNYDDYIIALSDTKNFRYDVYPTYKSNRKATRRPLLLQPMRDWVLKEYKTYLRPGLEADDVLGILSTSEVIFPGIRSIVSIDKDMKTIPGRFYNTGTGELMEISEEEADYWHLYQTLIGDTTDGYPGCPGIGPKKAEKLLQDSPTWETVVKAFEKVGLSEDYALTQARVARICRKSDYDFDKKEVILWHPKNL